MFIPYSFVVFCSFAQCGVCQGLNSGLGMSGSSQDQYDLYRQRYTNCKYVDGNLEITYLDDTGNWDLSFLESIEEVSGYVFISSVLSQKLHLQNLRLIRGRQLFLDKFSLLVYSNSKPGSRTQGLMELEFRSLQEIMNGTVFISENNLLCHASTIRWEDINPPVTQHFRTSMDIPGYKRSCGECDAACYNENTGSRHCWGEGPDMCQILNHGPACSPTCTDRCFGKDPIQCCHSECAAGCSGPKATDCYMILSLNNSKFGDYVEYIYPIELEIKDTTDTVTSASYLDLHLEMDNEGRLETKLYDKRDDFSFPISNFPFLSSNIQVQAAPAYGACKRFVNNGECVSTCPSGQVFNQQHDLDLQENVEGKITYGTLCTKNCSPQWLKDAEQNMCVKNCRPNMHGVDGLCVECDGPCPKTCVGLSGTDYITADNINQFEQCTVITGNLRIVEASFQGDVHNNIPGITVGDLQVFKNLKEVTGFVQIQSNIPEMTTVSFLSNLEVIHGMDVDVMQSSLSIMFTQIRTLGLTSLRQIKNGHVTIAYNSLYCTESNIDFQSMLVQKSVQRVRILRNESPEICSNKTALK